MSNKANVTAAKPKVGGAVYVAPMGTTVPTDAVAELDAAFKSLGYVSSDGLKNGNSISTEDIKAWGGDTVLTPQTEKTDTFSFSLIEGTNADVLKVVYGENNVSGTLAEGITIKANSEEHEEFIWVVDMVLKGGVLKRIVIPSGKVTAIEDITYVENAPIGYAVTLSTTPDEDGNTHYEYIKSKS